MRRLLLVLIAASLAAQDPDAPGPGHSRHGREFDGGPRQAARLLPGMNASVHLPVGGLDADAQALFDQGLTQLHGFWYFEAERSFREVLRRHPECAMAHWGIAVANMDEPARAAQWLANAVRCSGVVGRREQLYVDAWAAFFGVDDAVRAELRSGERARAEQAKTALAAAAKARSKQEKLDAWRRLLKGLGTLVYEFPDDIEAKAFLAVNIWHAYDWGNGIPIESHAAVDALLDAVFARAPDHPAHHYRIHLWDAEAAERALRSAAAIGDSAPGIAHQWHMAGHVYAKLHRHREAAFQQEASARVDHAHMQRERVMPFLIHNYGHNQEWWVRSLCCVGRAGEALRAAQDLAALPRHPERNRPERGDEIAGYARRRLAQVCEEFELWDEALALCRDGWLDPGPTVRTEVQRLRLLGRASFRLGRSDDGDRVLAETEALLARARAERAAAVDRAEEEAFAQRKEGKPTREAIDEAAREPTDQVRAVLALRRELRGERLLAAGEAAAALAEFEAVPGFPKLLLADARLAAGQTDQAIELLEREAKESPGRAPVLLRLLRALAASDRPEHEPRLLELRAELLGPRFCFEPSPLLQSCAAALPEPMERMPARPAGARDEGPWPADFGARPPLATLGPATWQPASTPGFTLPIVGGAGAVRALPPGGAGRPQLVVFYLGFGCLHCVEQLHALAAVAGDFTAAGIDVVAIGTDALEDAVRAVADLGDRRLPFPLLADPEAAAFRAFHCFDDFEQMPLHGAFLIDTEGRHRWQDIGAEPFAQWGWLLGESRRLLALPVD